MAIILSEKQHRSLELLLEGNSLKSIALTLGVSYSRVVTLLNEVLIKTGYKSRKELLINGKNLEIELKK